MVDPTKNVPLRVSGIYLLFGVLWIFLSDVSIFWTGVFDLSGYLFSLCKGTLFVVVSAISLYLLMRQQLKHVNAANALAHAVINGTTDAIFVKDHSGRYLMFNQAAAQFVGKNIEEVIGNDDGFLFDAISASTIKDRDQRIMESGKAETLEETLTTNNSTRIYSATKAPYRDAYGNVIGLIGVSRDITEKIQAEKQLRTERDRLSAIVDSVPVVICSFQSRPNAPVTIPFSSSRIESIYGISCEELAKDASQIFARIHPEDVQRMVETIETSAQTMTTWECEFRVCRPGYPEIWVEGRSSPTKQDDGSILWHGYVADITPRKLGHQALQATQHRLEYAQLIAKMGSWAWEPPSNRVWWSDSVYELYGLDPASTIPSLQHFVDRLEPQDRQIASERVDMLLHGSDGFSNEFLATRVDGSKIWILSVARATRDSHGRLLQVDGFDQDITSRKNIEEELRLSEERLRLALKSAGGGVWDWNLRSDQAWWSPEMYSLWGIDPSQPMRLANSLEAVHEEDRELVRTTSQQAVESKSDYYSEFRIRHPERGECWIASRGKTVCNNDGSLRLIGISQDISDRRRLEDHLRQSQKLEAVGSLAGGIAHDFNNLLTVISGYCRMLVDNTSTSATSEARNSLLAIQDAADRATRLTRQLLSFSRKAMVELQVLDLNQVVFHTSTLLRRLVGEDISLELDLASSACFIEADPIQIDQVILNLTVNARDASPKGSIVTIATRPVEFTSQHSTTTGILNPGNYIELTVRDRGVGMCDAVKSQIFEPFFSTKERDKGTGLGLAVVHGIVIQTGGQIDLESEPGRGTCFRIFFNEMSQSAEVVKPIFQAAKGGKETILLVEDETAIRTLLERALQSHGYQVIAASSGDEAIERFSQASDEIDILVTDYMMPKMNGRELVDELRLRMPHLLVLFISGYSDDPLIQKGIHGNADPFLQKPFLPIDLANKVRKVLDERPTHAGV